MSARAVEEGSVGHMSDLLKLVEPQRDRLFVAALVALVGHASLGFYAAARVSTAVLPPPPVEVEFVLREPPPAPPAPPEAKPEPPAPKAAPRAAAPAPAKAAPPPPAARAGAVVTALPEAAPAQPAEPFDFTSDPNSSVYGSGVVAVGGQASHGLAGAALGGRGTEAVRAAPQGDGLTPASDLSQRPRLREEDPCRGFFPKTAQQDVALVSVHVVIGKRGEVASARVVTETPAGQGFGAAARACMLDQTFAPALDRAGRPAATALAVNVRFSR
jgi:periplasmic protein TonB